MKRSLLAFALLSTVTGTALASDVINHKSPYCGCCSEWAKHMQESGFTVKEVPHEDMAPIKAKFGVPDNLVSCHTAQIDGYIFEGHVPADDIKAFLADKPSDAKGLAVPGMPMGSLGMDYGDKRQAYSVIQFNAKGQQKVFNKYKAL